MNFEKLTAAPWMITRYNGGFLFNGKPQLHNGTDPETGEPRPVPLDENTMEFVCLARQALDVMMRRKWRPQVGCSGWFVKQLNGREAAPELDEFTDPFTALVEADAWYTANVEAKR